MKQLNLVILDFDDIKNPLLGAGQAKATLEVGKRLSEKGHQVTIISSRYPGYEDRRENGMFYRHIGLGSKNIKLNNLIYILALPFTVARLKADVIIECFTAPVSTLLTPLWTNIPVVAIPTSFEADRLSKLYHLPFNLIEKYGSRLYKFFLPYSPFLEEKMKKLNPKINCLIVPEGVEEEFFNIKRKKAKHILFIGRYDLNQKGIDLLLEAYSRIARKIKLPLIIAGRGPDEKKIQKMIKTKKLGKYVRIFGPAFGKTKSKLLAEAQFVVISSRYEGFSLFALEAMAAALPVVSFAIPGLSWTSSQTTLKAKLYDTEELAKLMLQANEKTTNTKMSQAARSYARNYSWDDVSNQYEMFLYQVQYVSANDLEVGQNEELSFGGRRFLNKFPRILQ